jgi:hypothetical protein
LVRNFGELGRSARPLLLVGVADRVPGHLQIPGNLLDRLPFDEVLAPNPANRLHYQHSPHRLLRIKASSASGLIAGGQIH